MKSASRRCSGRIAFAQQRRTQPSMRMPSTAYVSAGPPLPRYSSWYALRSTAIGSTSDASFKPRIVQNNVEHLQRQLRAFFDAQTITQVFEPERDHALRKLLARALAFL